MIASVYVLALGFPTYGRAIARPHESTPLPTAYVLGYRRGTSGLHMLSPHRCRAASHQGLTNLAGHTRVWAVRHFRGSALFTYSPGDHCDKLLPVPVLVEPDYYSLLTIGFLLLGQARHQHPDLIP